MRELVYKDLTWTHRCIGNIRALVLELGRHKTPLRRVLDIGCGGGELLLEIHRKMGVETIGIELREPGISHAAVPIIQADAVRDTLPSCDVALAVCLAHHLSDECLVEIIRNVGRFCKRLLILDLVRHPLPLLLFRCFVAPFVYWINAADGVTSIQRSYTPAELGSLVRRALEGSQWTY